MFASTVGRLSASVVFKATGVEPHKPRGLPSIGSLRNIVTEYDLKGVNVYCTRTKRINAYKQNRVILPRGYRGPTFKRRPIRSVSVSQLRRVYILTGLARRHVFDLKRVEKGLVVP